MTAARRLRGGAPLWGWALFTLTADQLSKWAAVRLLVQGPLPRDPGALLSGHFPVAPPWLGLRVGGNRGAAWGLADGLSPGLNALLFGAVAVAAVALLWALSRRAAGHRPLEWALALLLGGAAGNLLDRLRHGYVVDFIDLLRGAPAVGVTLNLADVAIAVGAGLLITHGRRLGRPGATSG